MINKKTKYALRAVLALAECSAQGPVQIAYLAKLTGIPKKFLEQILLDLKRAGLLASQQGKNGGYGLAKPATEISIGQIIRVIEGPLALVPCVSQMNPGRCEECPDPALCGLRLVMKEARDKTAAVLDKATIGFLLSRETELRYSYMAALDYAI